MSGPELLTTAEMAQADALAVKSGVPSLTLMEQAGTMVAAAVRSQAKNAAPLGIAVLCGPGNNGGDGYVAARHLKEAGFNVWVEAYGDPKALKGDAAAMFAKWDGETRPIARERFAGIVVDALFGAGLSRPLDEDLRDIVMALNQSGVSIISVDVPSGLSGDTGRPLGEICVHATATVTFFRKKPGHLLLPGRDYCGDVHVYSIGIPDTALQDIRPMAFGNEPQLWQSHFPWPKSEGHKYGRGHAVAVSGPAHATGAARLAARGALRAGAGLVSVASPLEAVAVNAAHLTAIMIKPFSGAAGLKTLLEDKRFNAVALGPGLEVGAHTRELVEAVLSGDASVVLDADALTSYAEMPDALFSLLGELVVLTPHEGEFERLFPGFLNRSESRLDAARRAASKAKCVVLLKGPDTVIAAPDGRAAVNANAPPWLATAGTGDVLAGIVVGLLAQGMPAFEAASAAAWLHGEAANEFGIGLIAEDVPETLPMVLEKLRARAPWRPSGAPRNRS